ncbi:MAG: DUF4412 domain-containing protein [Bacteroidetes bacterium]|nr:DUF4412 domain-containing protein [Bacteroidota bacterium]
MKILAIKIFVLTVLIAIAVSSAVSQGLYWESITKMSMGDNKEMQSSMYYAPKMFKSSTGNNITIFRLDKKMIYMIDNQKKEYTAMTFSEMEASVKQANKQLEALQEQMKNMPAEQRKQMEKMMGGMGMGAKSSKIDVKKTGEKKTICGYSCVKYVINENGKEAGVVWTTTGVTGIGGLEKDMKEFSQRMAAQMPKAKEMMEAFKKIEGFQLETTISGISTTVTKIEKKSIPAGEFEIPAGYKKVVQQKFSDE